MKQLAFIGILLSLSNALMAQSFVDNALLFSRTRVGGSARIQGLGGAQTSLGGDFSSALSNPAGLGMYNRSEISISPALNFLNAEASYLGENTNDSRTVMTVPALGFVFHHETGREEGFLGGAFAVTMSRINDLNNVFRYRGTNRESSIIDYFKDDAYFYDPNEMLTGGLDFHNITALAYNNYLIEDDVDDNGDLLYWSFLDPLVDSVTGVPIETRTVRQEETINRKGNQNQWSIAYGANISDKLFFGATLGITSIKYKLSQVFRESAFTFSEDPDFNPIDNFAVEENLSIKGTGVNLAIGFIARPFNFLQIGASLVTPTLYGITDTYTAEVRSRWNNFEYENRPPLTTIAEEFDSPLISEYSLTTPLRFSAGITFISKNGFISGDVEMVNYSRTKYESNDFGDEFEVDNDDIKSLYTSAVNFRIGGEYRYDIFRARVGYGLMADPYTVAEGLDRSISTISGGVGVRTKDFFADIAIVNSQVEGRRSPYMAPDKPIPETTLKFNYITALLTVGFTFQ